ncbi:glycoside hydrolase [Acephala macrosclerotiorum]|nr:glycoside hydrolase [Acephala macrosclerotiorum]
MLGLLTVSLAFQTAFGAVLGGRVAIGKRNTVSGTAVVHLDTNTGTPQKLAANFIYGIPDTPDQIPDHFYTDIGFNFGRAGGAQTPSTGWLGGYAQYTPRFQSALSNYNTCRKYGARFNLLLHDLWGADSTEPSTAPFPGDNGDWTNYDNFLTQLLSDMQANGMTSGIVFDIWNEPDGSNFWARPQSQWIQMWGRCYYRLKQDYPGAVISGPSMAGSPDSGDTWWTNWASFIAQNGSVPDQYSWHMESGGGDMQSSVATYQSILANVGLPTNAQVNINEYGVFDEQVPSGGAWWISQLERVNAIGLRGNWLGGSSLHDFMAGLVGKPDAGTVNYNATGGGYWPAAEFQVYKYYAQNMTGYRVATDATSNLNGEVYAVVGSDRVRLLAGARIATGDWAIQLSNLSALGLPTSGTLNIHTYRFEGNATNHFQEYDQPTDLGVVGHQYSGDTVTFPIWSTEPTTSLAFEFSLIPEGWI